MFVIFVANITKENILMKTSYNLNVETELWKKFKSKCAAEGKSILEKLTEFIKAYISKK